MFKSVKYALKMYFQSNYGSLWSYWRYKDWFKRIDSWIWHLSQRCMRAHCGTPHHVISNSECSVHYCRGPWTGSFLMHAANSLPMWVSFFCRVTQSFCSTFFEMTIFQQVPPKLFKKYKTKDPKGQLCIGVFFWSSKFKYIF